MERERTRENKEGRNLPCKDTALRNTCEEKVGCYTRLALLIHPVECESRSLLGTDCWSHRFSPSPSLSKSPEVSDKMHCISWEVRQVVLGPKSEWRRGRRSKRSNKKKRVLIARMFRGRKRTRARLLFTTLY